MLRNLDSCAMLQEPPGTSFSLSFSLQESKILEASASLPPLVLRISDGRLDRTRICGTIGNLFSCMFRRFQDSFSLSFAISMPLAVSYTQFFVCETVLVGVWGNGRKRGCHFGLLAQYPSRSASRGPREFSGDCDSGIMKSSRKRFFAG